MPPTLPIDALLPQIGASVDQGPGLVLLAEPGAGKTTRVPPSLLEGAGLESSAEIIVAQPRRLAARLAAQRVAEQLGESVGERVGYQVRFESKVSDATRIRFVTEGLLIRRLRTDPQLRGVTTVILDEFHERHIDADLALALVRRLQRTTRPDLRLVVMSATLDPLPLSRFMGAPIIRAPGRTFPVEVEYLPPKAERSLSAQVGDGLRHLAADRLDGSVLVFLPGVREIRQCARGCTRLAQTLGLELVSLYGDLAAADQDRAVAPGGRPKLILSTNVAETSITIEGVAAVIDAGLVRRPSHDPWSGLPTLTLAKISQASAKQRAGRAGRTRAGRCVRLYAESDLHRRPAFDEPELVRLDLAAALLDLRAHGLVRAGELEWLDQPPAAAIDAAETLLRRLHAIDGRGELTETGCRMLEFPAVPRLARLLVEAQRRGIIELGASAAALLSERPLVRVDPRSAPTPTDAAAADVLVDITRLDQIARDRARVRELNIDAGAWRQIQRVRRQFMQRLGRSGTPPSPTPEDDLCLSLLLAFPDRVARVETRRGQPDRLVMAYGGEAELSTMSAVQGASWVVAVVAQQHHEPGRRASRRVVRSAAMIEPEWLLELGDDAVIECTRAYFDAQRERVEANRETRYAGLVIDATPIRDVPAEAVALLREAAWVRGARAFVDDPAMLDDWLARASFFAEHHPPMRPPNEDDLHRILGALCEGRRSFAEIRSADVLGHLQAELGPAPHGVMQRWAPTRITLAGGRTLKVHYAVDRPPWVESRIQDFFGTTRGPTIADGRIPLVMHLLAPNRRAVQVTTDLSGFWERHYPDLRKTLMRRYPRHRWPEDPSRAAAPPPGGRSRRR